MTKKRELQQEIGDLSRLMVLLDEVDKLSKDLTVEKIIKVAPEVASKLAKIDSIIQRWDHTIPEDLRKLSDNFKEQFSLFTDIYKVEAAMVTDVNRLLRIEVRRQRRLLRESQVQHSEIMMCAGCGKKPARIISNGVGYCKRCARDEGVIVKGKIV